MTISATLRHTFFIYRENNIKIGLQSLLNCVLTREDNSIKVQIKNQFSSTVRYYNHTSSDFKRNAPPGSK